MASLAVPKVNLPNRKYANVLVSSPTPERLKNVPQLKPTLKTWISGVPSSNPPDMAPWSPPREKPHYVWVPEGSCFPPSYLKHRLRKRHGPLDALLSSASTNTRPLATSNASLRPESPSRSHPLRRCASHNIHRTRVPDCTPAYISAPLPQVHVHRKQRRWSLGVPPSYISTEFITRRLESQRIDAIMGMNSAQSDTSNDAPSLPLPAIKVSTSTATISVSFPGSPEGPTPAPEPLAIRRGQKMLAPLTLQAPRQCADEEYPGIPTAFLGTPSAYSPHFQFASWTVQPDAGSLAISDMISTLRSQVADLKPSSPAEYSIPLLDIPTSSANTLSAASSDITASVSEDDWAFANDLMSRYGDHAKSRISNKEKYSRQQVPSTRKSLTPRTRPETQQSRARRASIPPTSSTPKNRPKSSLAPRTDLAKLRHSATTSQSRALRLSTPRNGATKLAPRPTSSPIPSFRPASSFTPSCAAALASDTPTASPNPLKNEPSTKRPPGILKHVKSVRFADMPKKDETKNNVPPANQRRVSTSNVNGGSPPLQPSPLRACFVPGELEDQTPSRQPRVASSTEDSPRVLAVHRRNSVQLPPSPAMNSRSPNTPTSPAAPGLSDNRTPSSGNSQRATRTLSLLVREHDKDKGKENSPLALRTRRRERRHTGADENAARRESPGEGRSRKHRLSSPLKSFLERLRA
ncbi:hypothetical protein BJV78DRAFT_1282256 [Lactifluus subvellereus]|nr:hypothetical protein BJV78DRAFT_1282256 [Lactifluus subvellereus]